MQSAAGPEGSGSAAKATQEVDLVALEATRLGLETVGLGLLLFLCAHPLRTLGGFGGGAGQGLHAVAIVCLGAGLIGMAPNPHGPLPRVLKYAYVLVFCASIGAAFVRMFVRIEPGTDLASFVRITDNATEGGLLLLMVLLSRFSSAREIPSVDRGWLAIGLALVLAGIGTRVQGFGTFAWLGLPLGAACFVAARHTAHELWLEGVRRNTEHVKAELGEHPAAQPLADPAVR